MHLQVLGDWLSNSGWTSVLVQSDTASTGTADSFIKVSHVTKTFHAHQVTAACIHILLLRAYDQYKCDGAAEADFLSFRNWCAVRAKECVQFDY